MRRSWFLLSSLASSTKTTTDNMSLPWNQLARAWAKDNGFVGAPKINAMERTLPLLEDPTSVPFVCRYRTDVIQPLSTQDVHRLSEILQTYNSLKSLRQKILEKLPQDTDAALRKRVECSISKSDLEDIYAPLKPPAKGSLETRINQEHPHLKPLVEAFWEDAVSDRPLKPRDAAITLLANKIASHTATTDALLEYVERYARVQTTKASAKDTPAKTQQENDKKYSTYYDFSVPLQHIRDHQVLAIRRGVNQKAIKFSFDIDAERIESRIRRSLLDTGVQKKPLGIWKEAIHDAWTRLLRKRSTNRLWKDKSALAEQKSIQVFCDNLQKALLAPPLATPRPLLALDPGFQAGIKTAVLDKNGQLLFGEEALVAVKFLANQRNQGLEQLVSLLQILYSAQEDNKTKKPLVTVALGNGHGSQEARDLIREASDSCGIPIDIQLVNEAGASVWSVTEGASREFPNQQPAAVAAVSIGRRYQNPLPELVKIPPRSLGLGMYQHDLSEKELDEKLHITSVHAVAEVGVDGNACSLEILEKIPGLTKKLCERIIAARPLKARQDLLDRVTGLGPKTFENCAAFIRVDVEDGDPLDATLVHPESYKLARHLLKQLKWDLTDKSSIRKGDLPKSKEEQAQKWGDIMEAAATKHKVSIDRVSSVMEQLIVSLTNPDPRFGGSMSIVGSSASSHPSSSASASAKEADIIGSIDGCSLLPSHLSTSTDALKKACPLRGVIATVRNVVDFGAFIDFGGENDGLIHRSKLGRTSLSSLLVGQEIGVDILAVFDNGRVSLALNGLNLDPDPVMSNGRGKVKGSNGKRSYSTAAGSKKKPAAKKRKVAKR